MDSEERRVRHRPSRARSAPEREPVIHGDTSHAVFFLRTGVQLAEDDGNSHMTQGHSARSKRSAYPSTSRGELEALLQERALPLQVQALRQPLQLLRYKVCRLL